MTGPAFTLRSHGGRATLRQLLRHHTRHAVRQAVRSGEIRRLARGRYASTTLSEHQALAHQQVAVLSHLSAALAHGLSVKTEPHRAVLTVPRNRRVSAVLRRTAEVHFADLTDDERAQGRTSLLRTVLDCARTLPFDEALCVADAALRSGQVDHGQLVRAGRACRGPGAAKVRLVVEAADGRSANALESVLRAITLEEGLDLTPQREITGPGFYARVDLASEADRLVVEAEGYETHGTRAGLRRDCRRYTWLALGRWTVLRFSFEDVMFDPDWVRWALRAWLADRSRVAVGGPTEAA